MICCYYTDMLLLQDGMTALHYACSSEHTEVVRHLINNNADISATDNVSDSSMFIVYSTTHIQVYKNVSNALCLEKI